MPITVSYYGGKKPASGMKPVSEHVVAGIKNLEKLPFGKPNPVRWGDGRHALRLRRDQDSVEVPEVLDEREFRILVEEEGYLKAKLVKVHASEAYGDDPDVKYHVENGVQEHDYSALENRAWDAVMPGIAFKHPGGATSGLKANIESGTDAGPRLDMGWGGAGGGNFELYSKSHSTRPGEFRIVYGGDGQYDGKVMFTHYDGSVGEWKVVAGITSSGRFFVGLKDAVFPGVSGSDSPDPLMGSSQSLLPLQHPFNVYGLNTKLRMAVTAGGMIFAARDTAVEVDDIAYSDWPTPSFLIYQESTGWNVKISVKNENSAVRDFYLTRPPAPTNTKEIGSASEGANANALTATFDPHNSGVQDGVSVWVVSRIRYDHTEESPKLYAYMTKLTWPIDIAPAVSAETRVEIDAPEVL